MGNVIKAAFYKLFKDKLFLATLIIGGIFAFFTILIYSVASTNKDLFGEINGSNYVFLTTPAIGSMLSVGFGIVVPINLVVFFVGEIKNGIVRNNIIAGISRTKIYLSYFLVGLVFTYGVMMLYLGLCWGFTSIFSPFKPELFGRVEFVGVYLGYIGASYIFITSFAVFVGITIKHIGGAIAITLLTIGFISFLSLIAMANIDYDNPGIHNVQMWVNPLFFTSFFSGIISAFAALIPGSEALFFITVEMLVAGILVPLLWAGFFFGLGLFLFNFSDLK